jgi:hypothetical protein
MLSLDPEEVFAKYSSDDLINFHVYCMERELKMLYDQSEKLQKAVSKVVVIQNAAGVGFKHIHSQALDVIKSLGKIDEDNYPEFLGSLVVLNAPGFFSIVFKLVKPFIDPITLSKICVFGTDEGWKTDARFLEWLSVDQVPKLWGGESEIEWTKTGAIEEDKDFVEYQIAAGGTERIKFTVDKEGSALVYEFKTKSYDIEFGVENLDAKKKKSKFLVPIERVDSHKQNVSDYKCGLSKGSYEIVFDNAYSWTTAKTVLLSHQIKPPMSLKEKRKEKKKKQKAKKKTGNNNNNNE